MSRIDEIRSLIRKHKRRLQKLKEQKASFGLDTPPHILTEIEDIEAEITKLQSELSSIDTQPQSQISVNQITYDVRSSPDEHKTELVKPTINPKPEIIAKFHLRRNQIFAYIHDRYSLELNEQIRTAFTELNTQRRKQGLKEYYPSTCFRLISPPQSKNTGIEFHLAPMNFAYVIMMQDPSVSTTVKEFLRDQIQQVESWIPRYLQSTHPILNGRNYIPLGIEFVIV